MYSRNQKTIAFQKHIGIALYYCRCPKRIFWILQRLGICCSYETVTDIVSKGNNFVNLKLQDWFSQEKTVEVVIDNIDFTLKVIFFFQKKERKKGKRKKKKKEKKEKRKRINK